MTLRNRFVISSITVGVLIAALAAASSDKEFHAGAAGEYAHQSSEQVIIGAQAYDTHELITEAFGKADLLKYGVLPVLVVIENKRKTTVDLRFMDVNLVASDGRHASPVPPENLPWLGKSPKPPTMNPIPLPRLPKKGNPLNSPEIVIRAFAAKMLPPGDSTSGFFYFEARSEPGDKLYVNGLRETGSEREIMYFEFPLKQ